MLIFDIVPAASFEYAAHSNLAATNSHLTARNYCHYIFTRNGMGSDGSNCCCCCWPWQQA